LQDERYVYHADPAADLDLVALSEPLAVGAHAVRRVAELRPNLPQQKILVMGGGTSGLACFFALKYIEQCKHVELHDLVAARVAKAIELGATAPTDVIAEAGDDDSYNSLYSGRGYDAIFETTAAPAAFRRSVDLLQPLITPQGPEETSLWLRLKPPFWMEENVSPHFLGTDQLGRDIWTRIVYGARVSLWKHWSNKSSLKSRSRPTCCGPGSAIPAPSSIRPSQF
jgi:hypothetical protein